MFIESQEDEKLEVLEPELKNRDSDFVISEVSKEFITTLPVRLRSSVYGVAAVKPLASWLFIGKQTEPLVSSDNNKLLFFTLHDEFIVEFDPGGRTHLSSLFSAFIVL